MFDDPVNDKDYFKEVPDREENGNPMGMMDKMNMPDPMNIMNPMNMINPMNMMKPMEFMQQAFLMQLQFMHDMTEMQMQFMRSMGNLMKPENSHMDSGSFGATSCPIDGDMNYDMPAADAVKAPTAPEEGFKLGNLTVPPELLKKLLRMDMSPENLEKLRKVLDVVLSSIPGQKED